MKEYLIQGTGHEKTDRVLNRESPWYRFDETSDGYDEYDALERLVKRTFKKSNTLENIYMEVRIRPTGRSGSTPFFPEQNNEHSNNKGLLSRFWIRFLLSKTEDELKRYGEQFSCFVQDKGFSEASLERMRTLYAEQLSNIRIGKIKPDTYQLDVANGSPDEILGAFSRQAANFLRLFGYRVTKQNDIGYEVKSLGCHSRYPNEYDYGQINKAEVYSATELVLLWQWITEKRELNVEEVLYDFGYVVDNKEYEYESHLRAHHINAYVVHDDAGVPYLCVLNEQQDEGALILKSLDAHIVEDYTDEFSFRPTRDSGLDDNYNHNLDNMYEK